VYLGIVKGAPLTAVLYSIQEHDAVIPVQLNAVHGLFRNILFRPLRSVEHILRWIIAEFSTNSSHSLLLSGQYGASLRSLISRITGEVP
jgi:hypothetical protein